MEMFTKCGRCGALVETTDEILGGMAVKCAPCAVTTKVSSNDVVVRDGCETTVLCHDCMEQLKAWLACEPEKPQGQEEAGQSSDGDSAERLAADLARAAKNVTAFGFCRQQLACGYFGHSGDVTCHVWRAPSYHGECPAYGSDSPCSERMFDDVARRCKELGIDLGRDPDAKR